MRRTRLLVAWLALLVAACGPRAADPGPAATPAPGVMGLASPTPGDAPAGPGTPGSTGTPDPLDALFAATSEPPRTPGLGEGRVVEVGGVELFVKCMGEDSPTVVLEHGMGASSQDWVVVQPEIAEFARACSYTRARWGAEDTSPERRTTRRIVGELRALLEKVGAPGPYILVGHSFGGLTARLYEHEYPEQVAGMVLVDASHPDQLEEWPPTADENPEGIDLGASRKQLAGLGQLGEMPLAVLTAGRLELPAGMPESRARAERRFWRRWQTWQGELARLSSNSTHARATESGHMIQIEAPELVVEAVRQVVEAARTGEPVPPCGEALESVGGQCVDVARQS
ncbi:MAG: alpha/beta fold hydrolase [Actinomycetota bacterium]|nr:alpha/beta fold hydrolase [Actinomycetota bacterium]MDP9477722.1 alpha/beta fold hydrolase [Actinomycetota bacterium]